MMTDGLMKSAVTSVYVIYQPTYLSVDIHGN